MSEDYLKFTERKKPNQWLQILSFCWISIFLATGQAEALRFSHEPLDAVAAENRPFWWHCTGQGAPLISYSWTFNDAVITSSSHYTVHPNGTLLIQGVTQVDVGSYYCTIKDTQTPSVLYSRQAMMRLAYISDSFSMDPSSKNAHLGSSITLQCNIDSLPLAVITWELNGRSVTIGTVTWTSMGSRLVIHDIRYDSMGQYQCVAVNTVLSIVKYSNFSQVDIQGKPGYKVSPGPTSVPEGEAASIHCLVVGTQPVSQGWYRVSNNLHILNGGRYTIYQNGTLRIQAVRPVDGGFYRCKATNSWGEISKTILLTILGAPSPPIFTHVSADITAIKGERITLQCKASGTPTPTITWYKDSGNLNSSHISYPHPNALKIINVLLNDAGYYICRASNNKGTIEHKIMVTIQVHPEISIKPMDVTVNQGEDILLNCLASGQPAPAIEWRTPIGSIKSPNFRIQNMMTSPNNSLTIDPASSQNHGDYTCIATNTIGTATASASVTVYLLPSFIKRPTSQTAIQGSYPIMHCAATGRPIPRIMWYRQDRISISLFTSSNYQIYANGSLQILNIQKSQEGSYKCVIQNTLGSLQATFTITVLIPPRITVVPISQELDSIGQDVQLDCMATGDPNPTVKWLKNYQNLIYDDNMVLLSNHSLYIATIRMAQMGSYTCVASNTAGSNRVSATIYLRDVPRFTVMPLNTTVNLTSQAVLSCQATAREMPIYTWYSSNVQGQPVTKLGQGSQAKGQGSSSYVTGSGTLVIQHSKILDEGWYLCVAENSVGNARATVYLDIQIPPVIVSIHVPSYVDSGQSATMTCNSTGDPDPVNSWLGSQGQGRDLTDTMQYTIGGNFITIKSANVTLHWGMWQCRACNILGCVQKAIQLSVKGQPVIQKAEALKTNRMAYITCHSIGSPKASIRYRKDTTQEVLVAAPPVGHQILNNGSLEIDIGYLATSYLCQAQNIYGMDERLFRAATEPVSVTALVRDRNSIQLLWQDLTAGVVRAEQYEIQYTEGSVGLWLGYVKQEVNTTGVLVTELKPYTRYLFRVRGRNLFGLSTYSSPSNAVYTKEATPTEPRNLQSDVNLHMATAFWQLPALLNGNINNIIYELKYKNLNTTDPEITIIKNSSSTLAVIFPSVPYSTVFTVKLRAGNQQLVNNRWSHWVSLDVLVVPKIPSVVPEITRLVARSQDVIVLEIKVSEEKVIEGFAIAYKKKTDAEFMLIRISEPTKMSFLVTGLQDDTTYEVKIAAFSTGGIGTYSTTTSVKTQKAVFVAAATTSVAMETGTIVGIVVGTILVLVFIIVVAVVCTQHQKTKKRAQRAGMYQSSHQFSQDDMFLTKADMNIYNTDMANDTVTSRRSGIAGYYNVMSADYDGDDDVTVTNVSSDTAYTTGRNNSIQSISVKPHSSDILFGGAIKHNAMFDEGDGEAMGEHTEIELEENKDRYFHTSFKPGVKNALYQGRSTSSPVYEELKTKDSIAPNETFPLDSNSPNISRSSNSPMISRDLSESNSPNNSDKQKSDIPVSSDELTEESRPNGRIFVTPNTRMGKRLQAQQMKFGKIKKGVSKSGRMRGLPHFETTCEDDEYERDIDDDTDQEKLTTTTSADKESMAVKSTEQHLSDEDVGPPDANAVSHQVHAIFLQVEEDAAQIKNESSPILRVNSPTLGEENKHMTTMHDNEQSHTARGEDIVDKTDTKNNDILNPPDGYNMSAADQFSQTDEDDFIADFLDFTKDTGVVVHKEIKHEEYSIDQNTPGSDGNDNYKDNQLTVGTDVGDTKLLTTDRMPSKAVSTKRNKDNPEFLKFYFETSDDDQDSLHEYSVNPSISAPAASPVTTQATSGSPSGSAANNDSKKQKQWSNNLNEAVMF